MDFPEPVILRLSQFLQIEICPDAWRGYDLYLLRDEQVAFYAGQSYLAFGRVWQHITDGFKGRSVVGRFILCNWPASMKFTIELLSSRHNRFDAVQHDLTAAERQLIVQWAPCFNDASNPHPTPIPADYAPVTAQPLASRSLKKLIREAERLLRAEEQRRLNRQGWS